MAYAYIAGIVSGIILTFLFSIWAVDDLGDAGE